MRGNDVSNGVGQDEGNKCGASDGGSSGGRDKEPLAVVVAGAHQVAIAVVKQIIMTNQCIVYIHSCFLVSIISTATVFITINLQCQYKIIKCIIVRCSFFI